MDFDYSIITSLDIGSSKTVTLIARLINTNEFEIIGVGIVASEGIQGGIVTNIDDTTRNIRLSIEHAENMAGVEASDVSINISGKHIYGVNSVGVVAITNKDKLVTAPDIYRVMDAAQSVQVPPNQEVLHILAKGFKVDDQAHIKDPIGMIAFRLEVDVHIVSGESTYLRNREKAINEAGLEIKDRVMSSLASTYACVTDAEKTLGVAVADIGYGVIDLIIYSGGGIAYTTNIPIGGSHITHDISVGLKTTLDIAEHLKKNQGYAIAREVDSMDMVEVHIVGNQRSRSVPRQLLSTIIEARAREILEIIDVELLKSGKKGTLSGGIILTGGTALLKGFDCLAEDVLKLPVSIGIPKRVLGVADQITSPVFATSVGLLYYSARYKETTSLKYQKKGLWKSVKNWIQKNL